MTQDRKHTSDIPASIAATVSIPRAVVSEISNKGMFYPLIINFLQYINNSAVCKLQFYKLFIIGGNKRPLQLGKGTFIIPININSPNMKSCTAFLKIYWNSNDYTTEQKNFTASNISEKEFKSLKKL